MLEGVGMLAGKAQFTTQEQAGYDLFRGNEQCNACHRDGGPGEDPLFTRLHRQQYRNPRRRT